MAYDPYSMAALEGGSLPMTGGGGGAMSGAAGAAGGFLTVASAAMGGGPWQGISDFLGGFNSSSKLRRHIEAGAPRNTLAGSINKFLNEAGLDQYKQSGKMSGLQGSDDFKNKKKLDEIVQAVKDKYPGYTQWQYAEMFKDVNRFMPNISISGAKESRKQELLNPETDPAWTTPEQMKKLYGKGKQNAQWTNQQLLGKAAMMVRNPNYNPKELRVGKGSNPQEKWGGRITDMTMEGFFKNIYKSINNNTFLPEWARQTIPVPDATFTGEDPRLTDAGQYTPDMPTVQDPEPTEPGLITEPVETPIEPPTEPDFEPQVPQVPQWTDEPLIPPGEEQPVLQGEEPPEVPPEEESPSLPPGLSSLLNLIKPKLEESGLGLSDILPSLGLEFPSLGLGGFVNRSVGVSTGGLGLTPVEPTRLATLPTGVQSGEGIPLGKFEYTDDYVGYPLL